MRKRSGDRTLVVALLTLLSFGWVGSSYAAGPDQGAAAATHFREGVTLYKDGDYGGALVEFRRAQEISPNYRVLYNIGQALFQLQRYAEALTTFDGYLAQGGAQLTRARRTEVEDTLRSLRARVGYVDVTVSEDGAEVRVDDRIVGTTPLSSPALVSVGHRSITVVKNDQVVARRAVDVAAGDHVKVAFDLTPAPAPPVAVTPSPASTPPQAAPPQATTAEEEPPPPEKSGVPWVPWAITGVMVAGTAVTGALALTSKSQLSTDLSTYPGNAATIDSDRSHAKTFALASDIFLGATALTGGIAIYLTFRSHHADAPTGAAPRVRLGLGGIAVEGGF